MMKFAVLGHPVAHSLSPRMHAANMAAIAFEGTYEKFDVPPGELRQFIRKLQRQGYAGLNITVPHKISVVDILDCKDASVVEYGACNTVKFMSDGSIAGWNTDVIGFVDTLKSHGVSLAGAKVFIVGAGGAGGALAAGCANKGARLTLANRTVARAEALAGKLSAAVVADRSQWAAAAREADVVVNATSLGLHEGDESALPPEAFRPGQFVLDIVPTAKTPPTVATALAAGADAVDGLEFLVGQGAKSFEIWTGLAADRAAMRNSLKKP